MSTEAWRFDRSSNELQDRWSYIHFGESWLDSRAFGTVTARSGDKWIIRWDIDGEELSLESDYLLKENDQIKFQGICRKKRNPRLWKRNIIKRKVNSGEEHESIFTSGKRKGEKEKKASKKMKGPCDAKCRMDCKEIFTKEVWKKIFTAYWKLTNIQEKRYYICARVQNVTKARCQKRTYDTKVRRRSRNNLYEYTL